jgi:hypothetical protein
MPRGEGIGPYGPGRPAGAGRGQRRRGVGPRGECLRPQCVHRQPHERGQPCSQQVCVKCGARMVRSQE